MSLKFTVILVTTFISVFALAVFIIGSLLTMSHHADVQIPQDLEAESVNLESESGSRISGSWIEGKPGRPTIFLMHGVRADRTALLERARLFKNLGYSVFLFDFQAHGQSTGDTITFGKLESLDAIAALKFVRAKHPSDKVGAIGISMGGAAALLAGQNFNVDALILESVYPDIKRAIDNRFRRWLGLVASAITPLFIWQLETRLHLTNSDLSPIHSISTIHCPVLILSGSNDKHTTVADTEALFATAPEPKKLELFDGASHVDLFANNPEKYKRLVVTFFDKYLAPASGT